MTIKYLENMMENMLTTIKYLENMMENIVMN